MQNDPLWYKDAIIYELHVRAFCDSDGDGVGDFKGLISKLDYLQELGVTAIWLLPFYPSPLKDDGYDIADYGNVHSSYGDLSDVKDFIREAHQRGLRVINELVLNHTSDQHVWFQQARRAQAGSKIRDFYVWSDTPEKYRDTRIIFKDFETSNWTWDAVAQAYFWHRFYAHQPDLNFENPAVRKSVLEVVDFWMKMGVDGMRLDAVPYLYEKEGTNCENLSETHAFLKTLRQHTDKKFKNRMLLAEANQWPEDAVTYFGKGDECHMAFHFPIMPRLFMAIHMEDHFPIVDILHQTPAIPEACQWALFLRNHDELTLEMVTDEERDYMYRVYANDTQARINLGIRRRLAPLLGNHRRKIELMNGLLFSLPGTPVIYYGDELGMGDNMYLGDRNGVRTPMQWSGDRNAGFSRANPHRLYLPINIDPEYHYETVNVEAQQSNVHSLLWWMKRLIALRKRFKAFGRGAIEFLSSENRKILAFIRSYQEEKILVVANLSRFVQCVELDLSAFKGMVPVEMFGRVDFPPIGELPYFITLGPHGFYWFTLESRSAQSAGAVPADRALHKIEVSGSWEQVLHGPAKQHLENLLPSYVKERRWFGGKGKKIKRAIITEAIPVPYQSTQFYILSLLVEYLDGVPERYILPMTAVSGDRARDILQNFPHEAIAEVQIRTKLQAGEAILVDAMIERSFQIALLDAVARRRFFKTRQSEISAKPAKIFGRTMKDSPGVPEPSLLKGEQSNSSVFYGDRFILKLFRRFEEGINPDLEVGLYLSERKNFSGIPSVAGALEYRKGRNVTATIGILQTFIPNQGDAWRYTVDAVSHYFEKIIARPGISELKPDLSQNPLVLSREPVDPLASELINPYLETARLLGRRTAELHLALSREKEDPAFHPEPFSLLYQRSLYQSMRNLTTHVFQILGRRLKSLPEAMQTEAKSCFDRKEDILKRFQSILGMKVTAMRIRCHGDYHLGQVLYTGKDFVIIDFEGEPARSFSERKIKRSPLRDVAGMLRSFHYAAYNSLFDRTIASGLASSGNVGMLESWARFWYLWTASAFLRAYFDAARDGVFLPKKEDETTALLDIYILEKAIYELNYELNNRPDWIGIPLKGISQIIAPAEGNG
ncbi:MAG TPA: maltose alpha-D-glucosyltransferase [Candidatus Omnitrophota bacterium]|nr:maltose alpha-D-glucosyltransferase [Candidatus Omnitrophota bacterium]